MFAEKSKAMLSASSLLLPPLIEPDFLAPSINKKWVQVDLRYFDPYFNLFYEKREIITVRRDIYYWSVVFFIQQIRDLVAFRKSDLVKANFSALLCNAALECYTLELDNLECNNLRSKSSMGKWFASLTAQFKISTAMILGILVNMKYTLNDTRAYWEPAQYI